MKRGSLKSGFAILLLFSLASGSRAGEPNPWAEPLERVYWGDLHVHTSYSVDAFISGMAPGRYVDEAGQYALYCSRLDFYSVTDHAEMLTNTNYWPEAIRVAHNFSQIGASHPDANGDPSVVVFTGWEWTNSFRYGHKNVILKYDDPKKLPPSPIRYTAGVQGFPPGAAQKIRFEGPGNLPSAGTLTLVRSVYHGYREGKKDTTMVAATSGELFQLLDQYCVNAGIGCEVTVIPHGNAWGMLPAMNTIWADQLDPKNHDPELQRLVEVYSKHGNSEQYSYFPPNWHYFQNGREVPAAQCQEPAEMGALRKLMQKTVGGAEPMVLKPGCTRQCGEPTPSYVPCCWQAGEIVRRRCADPESAFCREQMDLARASVEPFPKKLSAGQLRQLKPEFQKDPAAISAGDWGACGQCRDCYQPAVNYRNNGSVQKALASAYFDPSGKPLYYQFGFIGSTDSHSGWPGSVKENKRMAELLATRATGGGKGLVGGVLRGGGSDYPAPERADNFLNPGGLAAVLAPHRTRDDLWQSLMARNVYSTSGARIEVWARAVVHPGEAAVVKMGSASKSRANPTFYLKAQGALREDDTCPYNQDPIISQHFTREEFQRVCQSQCYRTLDTRVPIARIEVVKVLQPLTPEEGKMANLKRSADNPQGLIMDPYLVAEFNQIRIEWSWTDREFEKEPAGRSVVYYFRVIQAPTPGYNCRPIALLESGQSCRGNDPLPSQIESRVNPQDGSPPAALSSIQDVCYSDPAVPDSYCQERAWTSPFYIQKF